MDLDEEEIFADIRAQQLVGFRPGQFQGSIEEVFEQVHPEDVPEVREAYERALEERSAFRAGFRVQTTEDPFDG